ncbi:MAG TPA: hypothetical protein V6C65_16160 [Allocoleopsis sp.]
MIQQILNGNNAQKPEPQPSEPKPQKLDAQVLQGFTEYIMSRRRADAEAVFAAQSQLKSANNQLIEDLCQQIEQQIAHWQQVVVSLRKTLQP